MAAWAVARRSAARRQHDFAHDLLLPFIDLHSGVLGIAQISESARALGYHRLVEDASRVCEGDVEDCDGGGGGVKRVVEVTSIETKTTACAKSYAPMQSAFAEIAETTQSIRSDSASALVCACQWL